MPNWNPRHWDQQQWTSFLIGLAFSLFVVFVVGDYLFPA